MPVGEIPTQHKFAIQLEEDETAGTVTCIAESLRINKQRKQTEQASLI